MTSAHESIPNHGRAERLLGSLTGVVSAHVVREPGGRILEIHVLAAPEIHPKQVVRNVESALSAGLGITIDRRIVSVAQVRTAGAVLGSGVEEATSERPEWVRATAPAAGDEGDAAGRADETPPTAPERLEYVRCEAKRDAENCVCEVVLRDGAGEYTGSGKGPDTASGRAEAAARAVLDAIHSARPDIRLELDGAVISSSRGRGFVIVSAHALLERHTVALAGAASLSRSPEEAAILAALQATNRWSA